MPGTDPFAGLGNIDQWMCQHVHCLPSTHGELLVLEFISILAFACVALLIAIGHKMFSSGAFALLYICRSGIGNGAAFPVTLLLIFWPVSETVRHLFTLEAASVTVMAGSVMIAVMQVIALFKGP